MSRCASRGCEIPAGTARIRLQLISRTPARPALRMALHLGASTEPSAADEHGEGGAGNGARPLRQSVSVPGTATIDSALAPVTVPSNRVSAAVFTLPGLSAETSERPASLCLTAGGLVNWGGTPLLAPPSSDAPTLGGSPVAGRIAVWYEPPAGSQRSYFARAGSILKRASLFRPSPVGPWLYVLILLIILPGLALAAVRCLAVAVAAGGGSGSTRRTAAWLFAIAALNFACWALITPPFQAPDEVDHFAYTQSLVQRGAAPSRSPASLAGALVERGGTGTGRRELLQRPPGRGYAPAVDLAPAATYTPRRSAAAHPSSSDGGGNETAATHGAIYYAALAPAYWLASDSPFSQLTLMRLTSALIGALTAVFAYLLARELAPGRPWLGVLAALLVAYQPMYGFISGAVNNDVGVNAGAAALELLLILMLRRGVTWRLGLLTGALLLVLPIVKETAFSLYPVVALALVATLYRHHRRADIRGWAALAGAALAVGALSRGLSHVFRPAGRRGREHGSVRPRKPARRPARSAKRSRIRSTISSYLWQSLLPRLPFMTDHFPTTTSRCSSSSSNAAGARSAGTTCSFRTASTT